MRQFFLDRNYFPSFDVAVAELLAVFGSNVAALTVSVLVKIRKGSRPLFSGPMRAAGFFRSNRHRSRC
jgi:hypothetical protein